MGEAIVAGEDVDGDADCGSDSCAGARPPRPGLAPGLAHELGLELEPVPVPVRALAPGELGIVRLPVQWRGRTLVAGGGASVG